MSDRGLGIIRGDERSVIASLARAGLACLEPGYRAAVAVRNRAFDWRLRGAAKLPRPTISVGNLTVGGTGKTPMVIDLAQRLIARGRRPAILMRGYRGEATGGSDEAAVYHAVLGHDVPVIANPDRVTGADAAAQQQPGVDVFLLDDGFQHRRVRRDLDLVLVDATDPFSNGHCLPRGLLREPLSSLRRADAVIITRANLADEERLDVLSRVISRHHGRPPLARAASTWTALLDADGAEHPLARLRDAKVLGVCGLGNPEQFEQQLRRHTEDKTPVVRFPDHHAYSRLELGAVAAEAREADADAVVTTEKDWVKWQGRRDAISMPVYRPRLAVQFIDGQAAIETLLEQLLSSDSD